MKDGMLLLIYVDYWIILSDSEAHIDVVIHSLKTGKERDILIEEGSIDILLGIGISKLDENRYELAQLFII